MAVLKGTEKIKSTSLGMGQNEMNGSLPNEIRPWHHYPGVPIKAHIQSNHKETFDKANLGTLCIWIWQSHQVMKTGKYQGAALIKGVHRTWQLRRGWVTFFQHVTIGTVLQPWMLCVYD